MTAAPGSPLARWTVADPAAGRIAGALPEGGWHRGTLLLETDLRTALPGGPPILHAGRGGSSPFLLSLALAEDGAIALALRDGPRRAALTLDRRGAAPGRVRIALGWDVRAQRIVLTLEDLAARVIRQRGLTGAPALSGESAAIALGAALSSRVDWAAAAPAAYAPGLRGALGPDVVLDTPEGPRRVADLAPGDPVLTADGGAQPVLANLRHVLPGYGSFRPLRLLAPWYGRTRDILVQPGHRIALRGPEVEYMTGEDAVLIAARRLADGASAAFDPPRTAVAWHALVMGAHHLVSAEGQWLETAFAGTLARQPVLAAETFLGPLARQGLPVHAAPARREVRAGEAAAVALARMRRHAPFAA